MFNSDDRAHTENGYEVRNEEVEAHLRGIAAAIGPKLPKGWGFTLFIYEFSDDGALFYISNGDREGNLKALRRHLRMLETGEKS